MPNRFPGTLGGGRDTSTGLVAPPAGGALPERYGLREQEEARFLYCKETPNLSVGIDRSYSVSEADARKLGSHVILLDGAGRFQPLLDDNQHLYNLDHHKGCLRAFTLATCEQALVLVLKGLELESGDWKLWANEPDLDTVFSIWVLLNHRRLRTLRPEAFDVIVPLLRLEGAIDANGYEVAEYCGLPRRVYEHTKVLLDSLFQREQEVKNAGEWQSQDLLAYTVDMLERIDHLVYERADFEDFVSVEKEYGHVEIGGGKVAVVCRDEGGIYDVEKRLKKVWGDRLGVVALEKAGGHYTLRRTASLSGIDLEQAYEKLNLLDPAVDGRPAEKRWGGSDDIGGSPRPSGSKLSPNQLGRILRLAYSTPGAWAELKHIAMTTLVTAVLLLAPGLVLYLWNRFDGAAEIPMGLAGRCAVTALLMLAGTVLLSREFSNRRLWLFGWRHFAGRDWLVLVPPLLLSVLAGGAWWPYRLQIGAEGGAVGAGGNGVVASIFGVLLLFALVQELAFRGLAHGMLLLDARVQRVGGGWFVSGPVWFAALLFAIATLGLSFFDFAGAAPSVAAVFDLESLGSAVVAALAALLTGLLAGLIRERSLSLWPALMTVLVGYLLRWWLTG